MMTFFAMPKISPFGVDPSFGLPDDQTVAKFGVRHSWLLEAGFVPSVDDFASRRKIVGRGERVGHRNVGKIKDIDYIASVIKRELRYRDSRSAPTRNICLLIDFSCAEKNSASSARLCGIACLTAAALLGAPSTRLILQPFGLKSIVRPHSIDSASNVGFVRQTLWMLLGRQKDREISAGKFRYAAGDVSAHHCVLVSHFIDPSILSAFHTPMGMSTMLVAPAYGGLARTTSGTFGGGLGVWASDIHVSRKYAQYTDATRRRLGESRIADRKGSVVHAFQEAFSVADKRATNMH